MSCHDRFSCILASTSSEVAAARLQAFIVPLGISGLVYSCSRIPEPLIEGSEPVRRWVTHFIQQNYFEVDPLYLAARGSVVPQFWRAHQSRPDYTPEQIRLYQEIGEFGIAQGFDFAIRDQQGEASLCFYCENSDVDLRSIHPQVMMGGMYLHEAIRCLKQSDEAGDVPKLTSRENECLHLLREGLTYAQVARKLMISERTVTFHLQNAKRKLGVATLAQAIARSMLRQRL